MKGIAVITGTTHGIGLVTSRELAQAGYSVVMLCRNVEAASRVREGIVTQVPGADIRMIHCDLANLASVHESTEAVKRDVGRIDLLINNAGMVSMQRRVSADGFELTFATNHLGPFLLTQRLLGRMAERSRIVTVSSRIHYKGKLDLETIADRSRPYSAQAAYARSKLANVMHTFALARRLAGTQLTVNCLHPGVVASNLLPRWLRLVKPIISPNIVDVERGARTTLYLALAAEVAAVSGRYFDENQEMQPAADEANDVARQEALWEASERWVGLAPAEGVRVGAR